jgi:hypothetical protein
MDCKFCAIEENGRGDTGRELVKGFSSLFLHFLAHIVVTVSVRISLGKSIRKLYVHVGKSTSTHTHMSAHARMKVTTTSTNRFSLSEISRKLINVHRMKIAYAGPSSFRNGRG